MMKKDGQGRIGGEGGGDGVGHQKKSRYTSGDLVQCVCLWLLVGEGMANLTYFWELALCVVL